MTRTKSGLALLAMISIPFLGCSASLELAVDLRSDLVPGTEFDQILVSLDDGPLTPVDVPVEGGFETPRRIFEQGGLAPGLHRLEVRLTLAGEPVIGRRIAARLDESTIVVVTLTRDCRGVTCPGDGASPGETECLGGRCVVPECIAPTDPVCTSGDAGVSGFDAGVPSDGAASAGCEPSSTLAELSLPDWSHAGYRGGLELPGEAEELQVIDARDFGVMADDGMSDASAIELAIEAAGDVAGRGYDAFVVVLLPSGQIDVDHEISVNHDFVIVRGRGSDPSMPSSTRVVVRPSARMRYPVSSDGTRPDLDGLDFRSGNGPWIWPGRGAFRIQSTRVHERYRSDYDRAPEAQADLFEGSVNFHWAAGIDVADDGDYAGRAGERTLRLSSTAGLAPGMPLWVGAANSRRFYADTGVTDTSYYEDGHMRARMHTITAVADAEVTLDRPLEFDVPADSTSDGSAPIGASAYASRVVALDVVEGVGLEHFYLTYDLEGLPSASGAPYALRREDALHEYGNMAPEYALHGVVLKWALNDWIRDVRMEMVGSHPIATEVARQLQVQDVVLVGAWNKGAGGNGYLRGSRVWDSVFRRVTLRELRHFALQWSASGNVVTESEMDCDFNFHGGWERFNLVENNIIRVPYEHAAWHCTVNCGGEGGGLEDGSWYPLWWGAGAKAGKWSGATGPRNVLFHNTMSKQIEEDGAYLPYDTTHVACGDDVVQLGWDGAAYAPLSLDGVAIEDWAGNETLDFTTPPGSGATRSSLAIPSIWRAQRGEAGP